MIKSFVKISFVALLAAPLVTFTSCVVPAGGVSITGTVPVGGGTVVAEEDEGDDDEAVAALPAGATVEYIGGVQYWVGSDGFYYHRGPHGFLRGHDRGRPHGHHGHDHGHGHADHGHGHDHGHADKGHGSKGKGSAKGGKGAPKGGKGAPKGGKGAAKGGKAPKKP